MDNFFISHFLFLPLYIILLFRFLFPHVLFLFFLRLLSYLLRGLLCLLWFFYTHRDIVIFANFLINSKSFIFPITPYILPFCLNYPKLSPHSPTLFLVYTLLVQYNTRFCLLLYILFLGNQLYYIFLDFRNTSINFCSYI